MPEARWRDTQIKEWWQAAHLLISRVASRPAETARSDFSASRQSALPIKGNSRQQLQNFWTDGFLKQH
jgi:hypothetical protein